MKNRITNDEIRNEDGQIQATTIKHEHDLDHSKTARGDARPTSANRAHCELKNVLEEYGVSVTGFEALRSDAYEKMIAAESVAKLGNVYEMLLDPALGLAAVREKCPVWPTESRNAGKLPSLMTLRDIKERILLDWSVQEKLRDNHFLDRLRNEAGFEEEKFFEVSMALLGSELLSAKLDGTPIMENLRVFDRLLRVWSMLMRKQNAATREQLSERTLVLRREQEAWKRERDKHRDAEGVEAKNRTSVALDPTKKNQNLNDQIRRIAPKANHGKGKETTMGITKTARGMADDRHHRPTMQNKTPKSKIQAPEKAPTTKLQTTTTQNKPANGLLTLIPSLDLSEPGFFAGKKYEANVKNVADKILVEMAAGGPS